MEQHLLEGTYRPSRHRRLIAPPDLPPASRRSARVRWRELLGERHWWLSARQLQLARTGPYEAVFRGDGSEEADVLYVEWREWDRRFGLAWRLQNECPHLRDEHALAGRGGGEGEGYGRLLAIVEERVVAFDRSLPDPPGWELLEPAPPPGEAGLRRVRCGACGARVIVFAAQVAEAVPVSSVSGLRVALAGVRDREGFSYALVDGRGHFVCPGCGEDEYAGPLAAG